MRLRIILLYLASLFLFFAPATLAHTFNISLASANAPNDQKVASIAGTVYDPDGRAGGGCARHSSRLDDDNWKYAKRTQKANTSSKACRREAIRSSATAAGFNQLPIDIELQPDEKHTGISI